MDSASPTAETPAFLADLFATIDQMDAHGYADFFTSDATWRFNNLPPSNGHEAIAATAQTVFDVINAIKHDVVQVWQTPDGFIVRGDVTYHRKDGKIIVLPFASFYTIKNDKITYYQSYMDGAPLFEGLGA